MKSQVTVEYLLILVVMLLLFSSVSMNLVEESLKTSMQVQTKQSIAFVNSSLVSAAGLLLTQAEGASVLVEVKAPADCSIEVNNYYLKYVCSGYSEEYNGTVVGSGLGVSYSPVGVINNGERGEIKVQKV